jgi:hypothetical protein
LFGIVANKATVHVVGQNIRQPQVKEVGEGFHAWTAYLRVALRLSFRLIANFTQDLFHEEISQATIDLFIQRTADSHEPSEELLLERILQSPAIHVDETKISIREWERGSFPSHHNSRHKKRVDCFYRDTIDLFSGRQEILSKYKKRFERYRDSMFTFLGEDGIPWNNNAAERALRHLAIQRKISGNFSEKGARRYLRLLAIAQTCRFQNKSFLGFLLSGLTNVEEYGGKRGRSSSCDGSLEIDRLPRKWVAGEFPLGMSGKNCGTTVNHTRLAWFSIQITVLVWACWKITRKGPRLGHGSSRRQRSNRTG